jgi:hypothetical protein
MEQLGSHWSNVHEIWHLIIFRKSAKKIQVLWKSENNDGYLKWRPVSTYDLTSHNFRLQTKIVEKIKTHVLCSTTFSRKSCLLWDNVEKYYRAGLATYYNIIRRMRFACRITKARIHTPEYVILIVFHCNNGHARVPQCYVTCTRADW